VVQYNNTVISTHCWINDGYSPLPLCSSVLDGLCKGMNSQNVSSTDKQTESQRYCRLTLDRIAQLRTKGL
jgi:hypothetical protein